jgi:hypothetical protein
VWKARRNRRANAPGLRHEALPLPRRGFRSRPAPAIGLARSLARLATLGAKAMSGRQPVSDRAEGAARPVRESAGVAP